MLQVRVASASGSVAINVPDAIGVPESTVPSSRFPASATLPSISEAVVSITGGLLGGSLAALP